MMQLDPTTFSSIQIVLDIVVSHTSNIRQKIDFVSAGSSNTHRKREKQTSTIKGIIHIILKTPHIPSYSSMKSFVITLSLYMAAADC